MLSINASLTRVDGSEDQVSSADDATAAEHYWAIVSMEIVFYTVTVRLTAAHFPAEYFSCVYRVISIYTKPLA